MLKYLLLMIILLHLILTNLNNDEVRLVLKSLPVGKASGPDDINNRVLKELADQLATPFCSIFDQSIHNGRVPEIWKKAHVSPIPKTEDKSLVSYQRPISLLSNVDKVFERVIFKRLYNHLLDNHEYFDCFSIRLYSW